MCQRWPFLAVLSVLIFLPGCKKPAPQQPVVVHVFRDLYSPYAHELDHRILEFQTTNPRLPSGTAIIVQTFNGIEYKTALSGNFEKDVKPDAVILNSAADVGDNAYVASNLAHAVDVCAAVKACPANVPAFVPSNATGDSAEAAQVFVTYLAQSK